eukprot:6314621-Amphidinium_carterae.1
MALGLAFLGELSCVEIILAAAPPAPEEMQEHCEALKKQITSVMECWECGYSLSEDCIKGTTKPVLDYAPQLQLARLSPDAGTFNGSRLAAITKQDFEIGDIVMVHKPLKVSQDGLEFCDSEEYRSIVPSLCRRLRFCSIMEATVHKTLEVLTALEKGTEIDQPEGVWQALFQQLRPEVLPMLPERVQYNHGSKRFPVPLSELELLLSKHLYRGGTPGWDAVLAESGLLLQSSVMKGNLTVPLPALYPALATIARAGDAPGWEVPNCVLVPIGPRHLCALALVCTRPVPRGSTLLLHRAASASASVTKSGREVWECDVMQNTGKAVQLTTRLENACAESTKLERTPFTTVDVLLFGLWDLNGTRWVGETFVGWFGCNASRCTR